MIAVHASLLGMLLAMCSSQTNPQTIAAVVEHESGAHPWAMHDNTTGLSHYPNSYKKAVALAQHLIDEGHSVDMGLGQINSTNLRGLHATVAQIFIPCNNIWASDTILCRSWKTVVKNTGPPAIIDPERYAYKMLGVYHSNSMNDPIYENSVIPLATGDFVQRTVIYYHWWRLHGVAPIVHKRCPI